MAATINASDLPDDIRSQLRVRKPRETQFSKDEIRSWSLRILALMAPLSRAERQRVLTHAQRVNKV